MEPLSVTKGLHTGGWHLVTHVWLCVRYLERLVKDWVCGHTLTNSLLDHFKSSDFKSVNFLLQLRAGEMDNVLPPTAVALANCQDGCKATSQLRAKLSSSRSCLTWLRLAWGQASAGARCSRDGSLSSSWQRWPNTSTHPRGIVDENLGLRLGESMVPHTTSITGQWCHLFPGRMMMARLRPSLPITTVVGVKPCCCVFTILIRSDCFWEKISADQFLKHQWGMTFIFMRSCCCCLIGNYFLLCGLNQQLNIQLSVCSCWLLISPSQTSLYFITVLKRIPGVNTQEPLSKGWGVLFMGSKASDAFYQCTLLCKKPFLLSCIDLV